MVSSLRDGGDKMTSACNPQCKASFPGPARAGMQPDHVYFPWGLLLY